MDKQLQPVHVTTDESGHWYVIPADREAEFHNDELDDELVDSGEFDNKWRKYRTGGDLNNTQLYAEV